MEKGHVVCADCRGVGEHSKRTPLAIISQTCTHCMGRKSLPADKAHCFYFGVFDVPGHYLWSSVGGRLSYLSRDMPNFPFELWDLDSDMFVPSWDPTQGMARLTHRMGWTVIGFHDYSGDKRPNSKSVFILEGTHGFVEGIALAKMRFPKIWSRITFDVVEK